MNVLAFLTAAVLTQTPPDAVHVPVAWQSPAAVYGGLSIIAALVLWAVRQAFYVWNIKRDSDSFREAMIGNPKTGAIGLVPTLEGKVKELEAQGHERSAKIDNLVRALDTRPWCVERRREVDARLDRFHEDLGALPSKGAVNDAFTEIRALKEVVAEDRAANREALAEIRGALKQILDLVNEGRIKPLERQPSQPPRR